MAQLTPVRAGTFWHNVPRHLVNLLCTECYATIKPPNPTVCGCSNQGGAERLPLLLLIKQRRITLTLRQTSYMTPSKTLGEHEREEGAGY
jgi:hypothetical protein